VGYREQRKLRVAIPTECRLLLDEFCAEGAFAHPSFRESLLFAFLFQGRQTGHYDAGDNWAEK
jgi:hypothetical protein